MSSHPSAGSAELGRTHTRTMQQQREQPQRHSATTASSSSCCRAVGAGAIRTGGSNRHSSPPQSSGALGGSVWLGASSSSASAAPSREDDDAPMRERDFLRGTTDFMRAAATLDIEAVERMLAAGTTDVDAGDVLDQSAIILLSRNRYRQQDVPRAVAVVERLIAAGATITDAAGRLKRDQYGDATLHLAAMACGHNGPDVMRALLKGIPRQHVSKCISAKCKNFGNTALHWATLNGEEATCELLVSYGASLTKRNRQKETVLDYAVKYERASLRARYAMIIERPVTVEGAGASTPRGDAVGVG